MIAGVLHVGSTAAPELGLNDVRIRCIMLVHSIRCCTLLYMPVHVMAMSTMLCGGAMTEAQVQG